MYVLRNRETGDVIRIDYTEEKYCDTLENVFPEFDPKTMEVGWTDKRHLPIDFRIDEGGNINPIGLEERIEKGLFKLGEDRKCVNGEVVAKTNVELVADGFLDIEVVKKEKIRWLSEESFAKRRELIPDFKLQNALFGVYDEDRISIYRDTINAFRNEFFRVKELVIHARSVEEIESITARFPTEVKW